MQDVFFPEKGQSHLIDEAKRICMDCPVFTECNTYYQTAKPEYGVWAAQMRKRGE